MKYLTHIFFIFVFCCFGIMSMAQPYKPWLSTVDLSLKVLSPVPESSPSTTSAYKITPDDKVSITVRFNRPANTATVIPGESVTLSFPNNNFPTLLLAWSNGNKTLTISTVQTSQELFSGVPGSYFTLMLRGNKQILHIGNQPVVLLKSANGHVLDGIGDGHEGSDFTMQFAASTTKRQY